MPGHLEALSVLVDLARAAHSYRDGGASPVVGVAAVTPLGRRVLGQLRAALLDDASDTRVSSDERLLVAILRAIEKVREALEPTDPHDRNVSDFDPAELLQEVAHDLRSPLTSIVFLADALQRGQTGLVNERQRRQLGLIYGAAFGLSHLASDFIELARGGDRLVERQPSPLSIRDIFESVREIVRPMAEERRVKIQLLPPPTDNRIGHSLALSRVLLNLTVNALKFSEAGFVELSGRETGASQVEVSVRDTGKGIKPEALEGLYDAFPRVPAVTGFAFSGTGLGLMICRRLVHAMGSELRVESRAGLGSRFFFELQLPPTTSDQSCCGAQPTKAEATQRSSHSSTTDHLGLTGIPAMGY